MNNPQQLDTAILGGGCFWCLEAVFLMTDGVASVKSGYCGGGVASPTYGQVCSGTTGHAEVVKVEFDPARIGYRELLEIYFAIHDPTTLNRQGNDVGTQYRSVIFTSGDAQRDTALALIDELDRSGIWPSRIVTEVKPAGTFWPAEEDHDDYYWNNTDLPYCRYVISPKVAKFRQKFAARWRTG
ncbi:MAG: peptide-methionine (S)-S-oxide reductase [Betaproteobacteria bacterium]|nr:MAG: peptide-methionine (S)-S-oxide reductase [Betaproteobacteria bacterium]